MLVSSSITVYSLIELNRSIASVIVSSVLMMFLCYVYGLTIAMAWFLNWDLIVWNPEYPVLYHSCCLYSICIFLVYIIFSTGKNCETLLTQWGNTFSKSLAKKESTQEFALDFLVGLICTSSLFSGLILIRWLNLITIVPAPLFIFSAIGISMVLWIYSLYVSFAIFSNYSNEKKWIPYPMLFEVLYSYINYYEMRILKGLIHEPRQWKMGDFLMRDSSFLVIYTLLLLCHVSF